MCWHNGTFLLQLMLSLFSFVMVVRQISRIHVVWNLTAGTCGSIQLPPAWMPPDQDVLAQANSCVFKAWCAHLKPEPDLDEPIDLWHTLELGWRDQSDNTALGSVETEPTCNTAASVEMAQLMAHDE